MLNRVVPLMLLATSPRSSEAAEPSEGRLSSAVFKAQPTTSTAVGTRSRSSQRAGRDLPCQSDEDCNLNGMCIVGNGECMCYKGWVSEDCGELDILPVPQPPPGHPPGVSYGSVPSASQAGLATWGGSLLQDPHRPGLYHLFAAEISLGCGLDAWSRNSIIVHATAPTPMGPFTRKDVILPAFAHEPVVVALPASAGGGYVLYKIGCADGALTGSNGTSVRGLCRNCHNGSTIGEKCAQPDQSYERICQDALHSMSLDGPWRRVNLTGFGAEQWDWSRLNLGLESHSPVVLANGSVLTFTRAYNAPSPAPVSSIWLVAADRWNGTYRSAADLLPGMERGGPVFPQQSLEDTFMWQDPRGNFHSLFHTWEGAPALGGHAFSRDGLNWDYSPTPPYYFEASVGSPNTTFNFHRRERPHLMFNAAGDPIYLTNGVAPFAPGTKERQQFGDWTYTAVFPICLEHVVGEVCQPQ